MWHCCFAGVWLVSRLVFSLTLDYFKMRIRTQLGHIAACADSPLHHLLRPGINVNKPRHIRRAQGRLSGTLQRKVFLRLSDPPCASQFLRDEAQPMPTPQLRSTLFSSALWKTKRIVRLVLVLFQALSVSLRRTDSPWRYDWTEMSHRREKQEVCVCAYECEGVLGSSPGHKDEGDIWLTEMLRSFKVKHCSYFLLFSFLPKIWQTSKSASTH